MNEFKDLILNNVEWYKRVIPESKWLIDHIKGILR